jgi:hypothetical protein
MDPWPWQLRMQLALVIAVPILFIALALSVIYEREICLRVLDWLQELRWKRLKPSQPAIARLVEANPKAVKPHLRTSAVAGKEPAHSAHINRSRATG